MTDTDRTNRGIGDPSEGRAASPLARRSVLGGGAALAAGAAALVAPAGVASARSNPASTSDEAEIRRLSIDYALGTDAIAVGDVATGRELYTRIFAPDAPIRAGFDPAAPSLTSVGPREWADVVVGAFEPYLATQHLLGTIAITLGSNRRAPARMTTYLQATHVLRDSPELLTVLGTYVDRVERRSGGWQITDRFLRFTAFSTTPRTLP